MSTEENHSLSFQLSDDCKTQVFSNLIGFMFEKVNKKISFESANFPKLIKCFKSFLRDPGNEEKRNQIYAVRKSEFNELLITFGFHNLNICASDGTSMDLKAEEIKKCLSVIMSHRRMIFKDLPKTDYIALNNSVMLIINAYDKISLKKFTQAFEKKSEESDKFAKIVLQIMEVDDDQLFFDSIVGELVVLIKENMDQILMLVFAGKCEKEFMSK